MQKRTVKRLSDLTFGLLLGASLSLNVGLGLLLWRQPASPIQKPVEVPVGARVAPVPLTLKDGRPTTLTYESDRRPTVLYVLSPTCGWCKRNTQNIRHLAGRFGAEYRFVAATTTFDGLDAYLSAHPLGFDVSGAVGMQDIAAMGFSGTPFTAVVAPDGKLLAAWRGAFASAQGEDVARFFNTTLPGLSQE